MSYSGTSQSAVQIITDLQEEIEKLVAQCKLKTREVAARAITLKEAHGECFAINNTVYRVKTQPTPWSSSAQAVTLFIDTAIKSVGPEIDTDFRDADVIPADLGEQ
jgi:hypothetical protein